MSERIMLEETITNSLERIREDTAEALDVAGNSDEVFEIVRALYDTRRKLIALRCDFLRNGLEHREPISGD